MYCDKDSQGSYAIMGMNVDDLMLLRQSLEGFARKAKDQILSPYIGAFNKIFLTEQLERVSAIISQLKAIQ
jgi:hypothetical protein